MRTGSMLKSLAGGFIHGVGVEGGERWGVQYKTKGVFLYILGAKKNRLWYPLGRSVHGGW